MSNTFIHPTAEISDKSVVGENTKIWHNSQVRENVSIGKNCVLAKNVYIDLNVKIGDNVKIQNNVSVYDAQIEDNVFIGPGTTFTNDLNPRAFIWDEKKRTKKTIIKKGASIGANSTIIGGITIGEYAMIGAGSVVTKSIPAHALAFGNPCKIKGFVSKNGEKLDIVESQNSDTVVLKSSKSNETVSIPKKIFEKVKK